MFLEGVLEFRLVPRFQHQAANRIEAGHRQRVTSLQTVQASVDTLLRTAIQHRLMVRLSYLNKDRIVEPHDYGIQKGCLRLLAYQVGGSSSGRLPNWRCMDVDRISHVQLLNRTFHGGRPVPSGKHHKWDELFIRVEGPDENRE
jgi:hypothetical protein